MCTVSVVMATYNVESTVVDSITSIVNQTFTDWELIIIDDFSNDNTVSCIEKIQIQHSNIKLFRNKKNIGLGASLNNGIKQSKGRYIARMDGDDISVPYRLKLQVDFLEKNKHIELLGSNASFMYNGKIIGNSSVPRSHSKIRQVIHKKNPFVHPSVIFRKSFFIKLGGYDERLRKKQDYDLWVRGINNCQYYNLPDILILYRVEYNKTLSSDLYGLYVGFRNSIRLKSISGFIWTILVFCINLLRKFGYKQLSYRT